MKNPVPINQLPLPPWFPEETHIRDFFASSTKLYGTFYPYYKIGLLQGIARLLPAIEKGTLLDVGAGDGLLGTSISHFFPNWSATGVEIAPRKHPASTIDIKIFDGKQLPFDDQSFDVSLICNVIHHVPIAARINFMREVARVTRRAILIKDHLARGAFSRCMLTLMDVIGNAPFGGMVSASYLNATDWDSLIKDGIGLQYDAYSKLGLHKGLKSFFFPDSVEVFFLINCGLKPDKSA